MGIHVNVNNMEKKVIPQMNTIRKSLKNLNSTAKEIKAPSDFQFNSTVIKYVESINSSYKAINNLCINVKSTVSLFKYTEKWRNDCRNIQSCNRRVYKSAWSNNRRS